MKKCFIKIGFILLIGVLLYLTVNSLETPIDKPDRIKSISFVREHSLGKIAVSLDLNIKNILSYIKNSILNIILKEIIWRIFLLILGFPL